MLCACRLLWGQYSLMIDSIPFLIPNILSIVLNGLQLVLIAYTYLTARKARSVRKTSQPTSHRLAVHLSQCVYVCVCQAVSGPERLPLLSQTGIVDLPIGISNLADCTHAHAFTFPPTHSHLISGLLCRCR